MNKRLIASLILAIIVAMEIYNYLNEPRMPIAFEHIKNIKYGMIIGATIIVGGLIIFSLPKGKR